MANLRQKTICFFNSNRAWGGGEKWHFNTAKEFQNRGYKTFLVTNLRSELEKKAIAEKLNTFSSYIHNLSFINPFKIFSMAALFKSQKVDAVILNLPNDLKLAGIAAKIAGVKKIIYRRGMPNPLRNTWLNRFLFQKILTHIVVNSEEIGRSLIQSNESWFPKNKMILVYNGIDTKKVISPSNKIYQKKDGEIIIGNAGRLTEQKGQKYLIDLAEFLRNEDIKFKILIAGEGELKGELEKLIREKEFEEEIKLLGHVTDMTGFFNSLDLFVFTSLYEGSANTLIETLHHQVPTIAWDISSNPEIIEDDKSGKLIPPFDVEKLARAVKDVYSNEEKKILIKKQGLKTIIEKFDSNKNLNILEEII